MKHTIFYTLLALLFTVSVSAQQTIQAIKPLVKDKIAIIDGDIVRTNVNFIQPVLLISQKDVKKILQFSDGKKITLDEKKWSLDFYAGEDSVGSNFVWNDSIIVWANLGGMRGTDLEFRLYKYDINTQKVEHFFPLSYMNLYILDNGIEAKPREGLLRRIVVISEDLIAIYYGDNYIKLLQLKDNDVILHQFLSSQ
ncbi:MAG: hypothetical protein IPL35_13295 [Sphingobacteriales bacterium]|nr:hypothetical protein [Sphingobacteriales bacterium]